MNDLNINTALLLQSPRQVATVAELGSFAISSGPIRLENDSLRHMPRDFEPDAALRANYVHGTTLEHRGALSDVVS